MSMNAPEAAPSPARPGAAPHNAAAIDATEFKAGWRILLLAMFGVGINANSSMLYAFGPMVIPLQSAFGWDRADLQAGMGFLFGGAVVGSQVVGWLNLRYGLKRVTLVSLVALSMVFALMTQMGRSIGWLYLFFTLLPLASMGCLQVTWTQLVNLWFVRNRGLALAIVLSGTGIAAGLLPPGVTSAVGRWGWQGAFVLLALIPVGLVLPMVAAWMKLPAVLAAPLRAVGSAGAAPLARKLVAGVDFSTGIRMPRYWSLNLALVLVVAAVVTLVTSLVPLLRDKGLDAGDASRVFSSFGLSLIAGRVVVGYLVDRLWAPGVAAVSLALPAVGVLLFMNTGAESQGLLALATLLIGIGAGAEFDIAAYLVARYFGMRDYGRLFGIHLGLITAGSALAPWLSGLLRRATGSTDAMLLVCAACFVIGPLLLLTLGRYPHHDQ